MRVTRTESKRKATVEANSKTLSELRRELIDLRDELHATIEDTLTAKKLMLEEEELQRQQEQQAEVAARAEPPKVEKKGKKTKKKSPKKGRKKAEEPEASVRPLASDVIQPANGNDAPSALSKPMLMKPKTIAVGPQTAFAKTAPR